MQWLEYTLPREEEASQSKGWIQVNTKIRPVSEVATSYLHGKYGVGIRIWSLNSDYTHSWVGICHGSNKFVINLNNNETEIPEDQLEEYALKLDAKDFACRPKANAKPQRRELAGSSPRIVLVGRRNWIDTEPGKYSFSFSDHEVSKKVTYLLRHSQHVHREEDGAVHFWKIKENMFLSFYLDGWSVPRRALGKCEVLTLPTASGRSDQSHRLALCQQHSIFMPIKTTGRVGRAKENHTLPKGSVNHGQAATG